MLSLLEHFTIDFPLHFILSILDVYRDIAIRDKFIFLSAIMQILCHFSVPFSSSDHFFVMCAIDYATVKHSKVYFRSRQLDSTPAPFRSALSRSAPSTFAPSSSLSDVSLGDIIA